MNKYPDNVIPFPAHQRPKKDDSKSGYTPPNDVIPFLKEILDLIDDTSSSKSGKGGEKPIEQQKPETYENKFLTLKPLKALDFDLFENKDTVEDSELLDKQLVALSGRIGVDATKKLARVIEEYVAGVADIAYAEGLTEGAIPWDE